MLSPSRRKSYLKKKGREKRKKKKKLGRRQNERKLAKLQRKLLHWQRGHHRCRQDAGDQKMLKQGVEATLGVERGVEILWVNPLPDQVWLEGQAASHLLLEADKLVLDLTWTFNFFTAKSQWEGFSYKCDLYTLTKRGTTEKTYHCNGVY